MDIGNFTILFVLRSQWCTNESFCWNELDVSWSKPDDVSINGVLHLYIVKYCIIEENGALPSLQSDCGSLNVIADTTQVMLTNLTIDTLYNVSIAAFTIEIGPFASVIRRTGQGQYSEC